VQQKFAFAASGLVANPSSSPSSLSPHLDPQTAAESHIKMVSDLLNKKTASAEAIASTLGRCEGDD
jgi:hypothetical protein